MKKNFKKLLFLSFVFFAFISNVKAGTYEKAEELVDKVCAEKGNINEYCRKPEEMFVGDAKEYDYIAPVNSLSAGANSAGTISINSNIHESTTDKSFYFAPRAKYFVMEYALDPNDSGDDFWIKFGFAYDSKNSIESLTDNCGETKGKTRYLSFTETARKSGRDYLYNNDDIMSSKNVLKSKSDFIKINLGTGMIYESSPEEYLSYTKKMLEKLHFSSNTALQYTTLKAGGCPKASNILGISDFSNDSGIEKANYNYTDDSEIVYVSTSRKQQYSSAFFERLLESMMKYADSDEKFVKAYLNLSQIIDTGKYDTKAFTDLYYKATKNEMYSYMSNYLKTGINGNVENNAKSNFIQWFDIVGRYILEDGELGVRRFKDYFMFLFADPNSYNSEKDEYTNARTAASSFVITIDQESYEIILNAINDLVDIKEIYTAMDRVNENQCYLYCTACIKSDSDACTKCMSNNISYKACHNCEKKANDSCVNASTGKEYCFDGTFKSCLDKELGDKAYANFIKTKNTFYSEMEDKLNYTIDDFIYNLEKLDLYKNIDVHWKWYHYSGDCTDVKIFRNIWLIITIGAPFLVIVLGSIDFFKNVVTTEPEAKKKNKKRFIRRIIALVVLILTPFIIKLLINSLASSDSSANNIKLMQCIVNGK